MFKNATLYRIGTEWSAELEQIEEVLQKSRFVECGPTQPLAMGWVEPRGEAHGPLAESVGGQWMFKLMTEKKVVPGSVVKRKTDELAARVEKETGRKPGKKQTKEIKEQALLDLLPMAFTKRSATVVWIDRENRLLLIDSASQSKADEVVTALVQGFKGFSAMLIQTDTSPAVSMSEWLMTREAPPGFSVDRECELQSQDETKANVKYARHMLDTDEVVAHIASGKTPTKLAMTWDGRVSFVLTQSGQIKKISFLDVVFEKGGSEKDDGFDANTAITTGEMSKLIPDLLNALGGEKLGFGDAPAAPAAAVTSEAAPSPA
ncbi:MAG: recombination-associated protein RdgC [Rhizobacter sp.]|nr:recombination-associated protein RdgC [Rhizobacter sp.]